jgi:hypothetical protein
VIAGGVITGILLVARLGGVETPTQVDAGVDFSVHK